MCSYNILLNNWTANQTNSLNLNITYSVGLMLNFLPPFPLLLLCRLNILVVGGASGCVELYAYGMYRIATLDKVRELYLRSDLVTPISSRGPLGLTLLLCSGPRKLPQPQSFHRPQVPVGHHGGPVRGQQPRDLLCPGGVKAPPAVKMTSHNII